MKFDPKTTMWFAFITAIAQAVGNGTIHLTNMVPMDYIPVVTAWAAAIAFINITLIGIMSGMSSAATGPLAPPPTTDEAKQIQAQAVAAVVKKSQ